MEDRHTLLGGSPLDKYLQQISGDIPYSSNSLQSELVGANGEYIESKNYFQNKNQTYFQDYDRHKIYGRYDKELKVNHDKINYSGSNKFSLFNRNISNVISPELLQCSFILLNSICLNENDRQCLIEIEEETNKQLDLCDMRHQNKVLDMQFIYMDKKSLFIAILCCIIGFVIALLIRYDHCEEVLVFVLLIFLGYSSYHYYQARNKNLPNILLNELKNFHQIASNFEIQIDKIIKHLKESDIISHGNSFIQPNSLSQLPNRKRKGVKLRQKVMHTLTEVYSFTRTRERILLEHYELKKKDLFKEEYLAEIPYDVFAEILQETHQGPEIIELDRIKGMASLYREQVSEYVYSTILCLYFHNNSQQGNDEVIHEIIFAYSDLSKMFMKHYETLGAMYDSSVKLLFQINEKIHSPKQPTDSSTIGNLLYSSKLSLHSALHRIDDILALHESNDISLEETRENFIALINQYFLSLQDSKYCIDDLIDMVKPKPAEDALERDRNNIVSDANELDENIFIYKEPTEEIGDLLLEGESTGPIKTDATESDYDEVQKILKKNKTSKKLMRELKCILSLKDSPEGLISFPINKPDLTEITSDADDDSLQNENILPNKRSAKYNVDEYVYGQSIPQDDHIQLQFELNKNILQNINFDRAVRTEETFGSSDESECETVTN